MKRAKALRSDQTDSEGRLWYYLRAERFMGLRFKRQKPIGPYIVEFVCLELHLVIEADGGQHGSEADMRRDAFLGSLGFTVLRLSNNDILSQTEAVLERIRLEVQTLSPDPSPASGRGEADDIVAG